MVDAVQVLLALLMSLALVLQQYQGFIVEDPGNLTHASELPYCIIKPQKNTELQFLSLKFSASCLNLFTITAGFEMQFLV